MKGLYASGRNAVSVIGVVGLMGLMILFGAPGCAARRGAGPGAGGGAGDSGLRADELAGESSLFQFEEGGTVIAGGPLQDVLFS